MLIRVLAHHLVDLDDPPLGDEGKHGGANAEFGKFHHPTFVGLGRGADCGDPAHLQQGGYGIQT